MTNFIPIFPLNLVVYPGEKLNLHIFEPRYKQLIRECYESGKPFGIPAVINNQVKDMGCLVHIREMVKEYENGEMDIKTEAQQVFRILEIIQEIPEKMYSGAIVTYPPNNLSGNPKLMKKVLEGIRLIHLNIGASKTFDKPDDELISYDVAHHAGLSTQDEYRLLEFTDEAQRQELLKRHLTRLLPVVNRLDELRNKIRLNGHFKSLPGFNT